MEKTLLLLFTLLVVTIPFLYRIIRQGNISWYVEKDQLTDNNHLYKAEQLRFVQIIFGYFYFLIHGSIVLGWANIIIFITISFSIGAFMEIIGSKTGIVFGGKYKFNSNLFPGPFLFKIPLIIPLSWSGLTYMSLSYCNLVLDDSFSLLFNQNIMILFIPSILLVAIDLVLDPIAVDEKRWFWENPGSYYGVPVLNFIGWFFTSLLIISTFKLFHYQIKIDKEINYLYLHSPGFLFCVLPAIASRPCFERDLKIPGVIGLVISTILYLIVITS